MTRTLTLTGSLARKLYPTAAPELKIILEENFTREFFSQKITDRIKTFEDACEELGESPDRVLSNTDSPDEAAYKKLKVIAKALNEGWQPNWKNSSEQKWYPWFYMDHSQDGFCLDCVHCLYTLSRVGSRLCFRTSELAKYAAEQFSDLYKTFFTL